jgi:AcrR family transcriptional regulator
MSIRDDRRTAALARITRHLLETGLPGSGLRSLAQAAGVSDRMLLYYFANKNEVLTLALRLLAAEMAAALDQTIPASPKRGFPELRREIREAVRGGALRPFMRLWLEIVSRAARDEPPYRDLAGQIADGFATWIALRLHGAHEADPALLLATVEGIVMFDAIGRGNLADAAVSLARK